MSWQGMQHANQALFRRGNIRANQCGESALPIDSHMRQASAEGAVVAMQCSCIMAGWCCSQFPSVKAVHSDCCPVL